jgi:hypothetical protein
LGFIITLKVDGISGLALFPNKGLNFAEL